MSEIELLIILCFYYIGKERGIEKFSTMFNVCFGKELSKQTILYEVAIVKNANPANNVSSATASNKYKAIWNKYIHEDSIPELRSLYREFMRGEFGGVYEFEKESLKKARAVDIDILDEPKPIVDEQDISGKRNRRDSLVAERALMFADYVCEGECGIALFLRADGLRYYTEAHHLIPLSFQDSFEFSLDVEANIVSLCPMCHRLLHYGRDKADLLTKLYYERIDRLEKCGLFITLDQLKSFYDNGT